MKRVAFRNVSLCSLFFGRRKPDFQKEFDQFLNEIAQGYTIQSTTKTYKVELIPILIIADLIAKAKLLNMRQYNGYYGCSMCFMPGIHVGGAHLHPHSERFQKRTPLEHMKLIQKAEQGKSQHDAKRSKKRYEGVKGVLGGGKIYDLLPSLPLTAPIDILHQLYLGVADELLSFFITALKFETKLRLTKPWEIWN